jgi:hypothetical protein
MKGKTQKDVEKLLGRPMEGDEQMIFDACKDDDRYFFETDDRGHLMANTHENEAKQKADEA